MVGDVTLDDGEVLPLSHLVEDLRHAVGIAVISGGGECGGAVRAHGDVAKFIKHPCDLLVVQAGEGRGVQRGARIDNRAVLLEADDGVVQFAKRDDLAPRGHIRRDGIAGIGVLRIADKSVRAQPDEKVLCEQETLGIREHDIWEGGGGKLHRIHIARGVAHRDRVVIGGSAGVIGEGAFPEEGELFLQ